MTNMDFGAQSGDLRVPSDTYMSMPWAGLEQILTKNNFQKVSSYEFNGNEEYVIWVKNDKGLLLTTESYTSVKKGVNRINLYYEVEMPENFTELSPSQRQIFYDVFYSPNSGSWVYEGGDIHNRTIAFCVAGDAKEGGLIKHLSEVENSGFKLNNPWKYLKNHVWLDLMDYVERKKGGCEEINQRKIANLPLEVQVMIGARQ